MPVTTRSQTRRRKMNFRNKKAKRQFKKRIVRKAGLKTFYRRHSKAAKKLEVSAHNDLSMHSLRPITFNRRKIKSVGKVLYSNQNQFIVEAPQGRQAIGWPEANLTRPQLMGDTDNNILERIRWPDDPFKLALEPAIVPSTLYPGPFPSYYPCDKLNIQKIEHTLEILSMTNIPQHVSVYWLMPKRDTSEAPDALWESLLVIKTFTQGNPTIPTAVIDTTAVAGGVESDFHGQSPWDHPEFRKAWIPIRSEEISLQPGDQRKYHLTMNYNKVLNRADLVTNRTDTYLKGLTLIPFIISRGGLVGVERADPADPNTTRVAYGFAKVGTISTYKMTFGNLPTSRHTTTRMYSGVINLTGDNLKIIDAEDDEVLAEFT